MAGEHEIFLFRFTPAYRYAGVPFGVTPASARVHLVRHPTATVTVARPRLLAARL
jgi:hypothetical protein